MVADFHIREDVGVRIYLAVVAYLYIVIDEGVWPDLDVLAKFCICAYGRKRMNFYHYF